MKTQFVIAAAALAAISASCSHDSEMSNPEVSPVTLSVNVGMPRTRLMLGADNTADLTANTVQVFVFNALGELEQASERVAYGSEISLSVIPGDKTVWAVANAPVISGITSLDQFPLLQSNLSDNAPNALVMSGSFATRVMQDSSIDVTVKHIAAKVVLNKITRSFSDPHLSAVPMTLKRIYMSNVAAVGNYGCTGVIPQQWICKQGLPANPPQLADLLMDDNLNGDLSEGKTYNTAHTFYVYPNPVDEDSVADEWCARKTRLVLQCDYNGRTCYYPITIPGQGYSGNPTIDRNKVYHISGLTLTAPGSTDPDKSGPQVSSDVDCTFSITVSEWEDDFAYEEEF
ncbi:MAG: hypothetical protein J5764_03940 [Bacteroidales bacterium]|nr:hypothetical protein [Bacteroidales bacterium]